MTDSKAARLGAIRLIEGFDKLWESPEEHWGRRALPRKGSATVSSPRHPPVSAGRGVPRLLPLPRPKSPRMRIAPYPRKQSNNSAIAVERPNRWLINSLTTRHFARERVQPLRKSYLSPGQFFLASRIRRFGPISRSRLACGCVESLDFRAAALIFYRCELALGGW